MLATPARLHPRGPKPPVTLAAMPPLRPLPVGVPLVPGEDHKSLMWRLARANHLPSLNLRDVLPQPTGTELINLAGLATLAGQPLQRLQQALDARPDRWLAMRQLACSRCMARRGIPHRVLIEVANHQPLCRRHRRWLSPQADWAQEEYDLTPVPEVLRAQRRHAALMHQHHGWNDTAEAAYGHARHILHRWAQRHDWSTHRDRRLAYFLDTSRYRVTEFHPLISMVNYPETVTLARILADPHWVAQATARGLAGLTRFHNEVRRRLRIDYEPYHARDPLVLWREHTHRARNHASNPGEVLASLTPVSRRRHLADQDNAPADCGR